MDTLDTKALAFLVQNGRATWAELGAHLGLSAPSAADRIRKLEEAKVITGYSALLDATAMGYPLTAFIFVTLAGQRNRAVFLRAIAKMPHIVECHHVAGDHDYLLKARCRTTADLDDLLANQLKQKLGIARTRTTIVLATAKETVQIPMAQD